MINYNLIKKGEEENEKHKQDRAEAMGKTGDDRFGAEQTSGGGTY
jgi:hypothetical protein